MDRNINLLRASLPADVPFRNDASLQNYTTLQAGGSAAWLIEIKSLDMLADTVVLCQEMRIPNLVIGSGSNILVSDSGFGGLIIVNRCAKISYQRHIHAECGCWFQDLFLFAAQKGLAGLEFAVGIPGTLGGALVSNAGAYRSNISDLLASIEIVEDGERRWVSPSTLQFAYRNSILRAPSPPPIVLLSVLIEMAKGNPKQIFDRAREYQRQRISKQPPHASAGSFFKNVYSKAIADQLEELPSNLRELGLVPAGYLIEACGLKGSRIGNAIISAKHANIICNLGSAKAADIRSLAELAKQAVDAKFGVQLEEEVLYIGDWQR